MLGFHYPWPAKKYEWNARLLLCRTDKAKQWMGFLSIFVNNCAKCVFSGCDKYLLCVLDLFANNTNIHDRWNVAFFVQTHVEFLDCIVCVFPVLFLASFDDDFKHRRIRVVNKFDRCWSAVVVVRGSSRRARTSLVMVRAIARDLGAAVTCE